MDEARLAEIEARANAATPGPLTARGEDGDYPITDCVGREVGSGYDRETASFFAHAREDVPALVAEVRRLRDDPSKDDTDEAHPAWWRGYHADKGELALMVDVASADARSARARVALLEAERDEARARQHLAEAALARLSAQDGGER